MIHPFLRFFRSVPALSLSSICWGARISIEDYGHTRTRTTASPLSESPTLILLFYSSIFSDDCTGTWIVCNLCRQLLGSNLLSLVFDVCVHTLWIGFSRRELFKYPTLLSPLNKYWISATNTSNHFPLSPMSEKLYDWVRLRVTPSEVGSGSPSWYNSWRYRLGKWQWYNRKEVCWM